MEERTFFDEIGEKLSDTVIKGQLFGKPCFKINGKAFVCFFQNCMVFKLKGVFHAAAMNLEGAILFDPSGKKRPMKEWVQLPYIHKSKWEAFAIRAMDYVANL